MRTLRSTKARQCASGNLGSTGCYWPSKDKPGMLSGWYTAASAKGYRVAHRYDHTWMISNDFCRGFWGCPTVMGQ